MKKKLIPFLALIVILASCKKDVEQQVTETPATAAVQRGGNPCTKSDLINYGGGVYKANYEGFTVTVTNLSYLLYQNGQPLPLRDGDPAFGNISVPASSGQDVMVTPTAPYSNFALTQLVWGANNVFGASYAAAVSHIDSQYTYQMNIYNNLPPAVQAITVVPTRAPVWMNDHIQSFSTPGSSGVQIFTGRLIRSTSGNTGFALACEHYPMPAPLQPYIVPEEAVLHKNVVINGVSINIYMTYSTVTSEILNVEAFDTNCNPVTVVDFTNGIFTSPSRFVWTTSDTIHVTVLLNNTEVEASFTGTLESALNPC